MHICAHGVLLHSLSKIGAVVDRIESDGLDGAIGIIAGPAARSVLSQQPSWQSSRTTIAAANLVFSDVLHHFPKLKVILAHGRGCVAALCGRWQRGALTARPGIPALSLSPADAVRRSHVYSLVHSPAMLRSIIDIAGEDRMLLGSDWPFPMGAPSAEYDLGPLDAALKTKIRKTNAEAVFGTRLGPPSSWVRSDNSLLPTLMKMRRT